MGDKSSSGTQKLTPIVRGLIDEYLKQVGEEPAIVLGGDGGSGVGVLADLMDMLRAAASMDANIYVTSDGLQLPLGEIDDPALLAALMYDNQLVLSNAAQGAGIAAWRAASEHAEAVFNDALTQLKLRIGIEDMAVDEAQSAIDRALEGKDRATERAEFVADFLRETAGWRLPEGSDGKITPDMMGGLGRKAASLLGLAPGSSLLEYGTMTVDPAALYEQFDEQMGVGGPLPDIYRRTIGMQDIPAPPDRSAYYGGGGGGGAGSADSYSLLDALYQRALAGGASDVNAVATVAKTAGMDPDEVRARLQAVPEDISGQRSLLNSASWVLDGWMGRSGATSTGSPGAYPPASAPPTRSGPPNLRGADPGGGGAGGRVGAGRGPLPHPNDYAQSPIAGGGGGRVPPGRPPSPNDYRTAASLLGAGTVSPYLPHPNVYSPARRPPGQLPSPLDYYLDRGRLPGPNDYRR